MIKIFLPDIDNRFYNSIKYLSDNLLQIYSYPPIDIYKIHNKISADAYVFDSSYISTEIMQFINEYSEVSIKTFIYHSDSTLNKDVIRYVKKSKHIVPSDIFDEFSKYKNVIGLPKYIINDEIFHKTNNDNRADRIVYLLDNDDTIPQFVADRLYPNQKNSKILLFNNNNISHPQNLGLLKEKDKAKIFNEYKYYLCDKYSEYIAEATTCGCVALDNSFTELSIDTNSIKTFREFIRTIL